MPEKMKVITSCKFCLKGYDIFVHEQDWDEFTRTGRTGRKIQEIFPYLSAGEREIFISGMCNTCWDKTFKTDE